MRKNIYSVSGVVVHKDYQGQGIGKFLYLYLVNIEKFNILGDSIQYFGARKLWSNISKHSKLTVDLINIVNGDIIEHNVRLKHGDLDHEFDPRLWSYNMDKIDIRPLLRKIK